MTNAITAIAYPEPTQPLIFLLSFVIVTPKKIGGKFFAVFLGFLTFP
jgi:hypothetical protein